MTEQQIVQFLRYKRDCQRTAKRTLKRGTAMWHQFDGAAWAIDEVLREIRRRRKEEREGRP